ncbi:MAG: PASTA domain-containing protein [Bacteroidota bacterium]
MKMFKYFISKEFFLTLGGLGLAGALLYIAIFFWILPAYTRHGEGLLVPDVSEMTVEEAEEALKDAGLRPTRADSIFLEHLPPGVVIKQYPGPFSRVKPKRSVALTINKAEPPMVQLPDIIDISLYSAKARLEAWRLSVGKVTLTPDIANVVIKTHFDGQEIKSGQKVPQGAKIDLFVGTGRNTFKVPIPDLVGYSYEDALSLLRSSNLSLGGVVYNADGPEESMGRVYAQSPRSSFGDSLRAGSAIDIYVYGAEPETNEGIIVEEVDEN